jgi:transcriptional regulator with XRE-family HTH domain
MPMQMTPAFYDYDTVKKGFAAVVKSMREQSGLSYGDFARRSRMSLSTYVELEEAEGGASIHNLMLIAFGAERSPEDLLTELVAWLHAHAKERAERTT